MINGCDMRKVMREYEPDYSIWREDDERMTRIKEAVQKLADADRIIFIMYCETGSLRELGRILGVSHTSAFKEINRIKRQILNEIGDGVGCIGG